MPTWASSGSVNRQYGMSRPRVVRLPPARLSRTTRQSSSPACVNCGLPAHSPVAHTSGALVCSLSLTRTYPRASSHVRAGAADHRAFDGDGLLSLARQGPGDDLARDSAANHQVLKMLGGHDD